MSERKVEKPAVEKHRKYRRYTGISGIIVQGLFILLVLVCVLFLTRVLTSRLIFLHMYQLVALGMSISFPLIFLLIPARQRDIDKLAWYDMLLIAAAVITCLYAFYAYTDGQFSMRVEGLLGGPLGKMRSPIIQNPLEFALAIIFLIVVVESGRRVLGLTMAIIALFFIIYPLISYMLPGILMSRYIPLTTVLERLYFSSDTSVFTQLAPINFRMLWPFLLFATFLRVTGGAQLFIDLALSVAGRFRGGAGKSMVVASALMGTMTGSAVADVAAVGSITIPFMKSQGYSPSFAGALAAAAGTGAHVVPPVLGTVAFVMADIMETSYWSICLAALIPGILYYTNLFMTTHFYALNKGLRAMSPSEIPSVKKSLLNGGHLLLPILVLVYFLGVLNFSPERSSLYALASLILVSFFRQGTRLSWSKFMTGIRDGALLIAEMGVILVVVSPLVASLDITGLGPSLSGSLVDLAGGNVLLLLLLAGVTCYFLGLALPTVTSYLLLALLVAPAIVSMGIPKLAAHFFILFITLSDVLTPPAAPAAYVAAGIAGAPPLRTAFLSMLLGIGIIVLPFYFAYNPALLLIGPFSALSVFTIIGAFIGAVFLGACIGGYFLAPFKGIPGILGRLVLVAGALLLMFPLLQFKIIGVLLGALVAGWQILHRRVIKKSVSVKTL